MLIFFQVTTGSVPLLLWLTLVIVLYLTVIELRPRQMPRNVKLWWVSVALLTHVFGYVALRAYLSYRRSHDRAGE